MQTLQGIHERAAPAVTPAVLVLAQSRINITPDKSKAPGTNGLLDIVNGIAFYALISAAAGFLIGACCWAVGGRIGNDYTATNGKVGMVVAAGCAFLVGAATVILNFAYNTGSGG